MTGRTASGQGWAPLGLGREHLALLALWAVASVMGYLLLGMRSGGDTRRYVDAAASLLSFRGLEDLQLHAILYEGLLAAVLAVAGDPRYVVVPQLMISLAAAFALHAVGERVWCRGAGRLAALVYLVEPGVQRWNYFVLPESLATSFLILVTAMVLLRSSEWAVVAVGLALGLTRPEGPVLLIPLVAYLFFTKRWAVSGVLLGIVVTILVLRPTAYGEVVTAFWRHGAYITDYPGLGEAGWTVFVYRVAYHLVGARPFYSLRHNVFNIAIGASTYALAIVATVRLGPRHGGSWVAWAMLLVMTGVTAVIGADWDGRWRDRVLPLLFVPAAAALVQLTRSTIQLLRDVCRAC